MDFDLDEEERGLQRGIRELLAGRFPMSRVREGFSRDAWRELGEAGVFGITVAASSGGLGLGMTHATVVYEELGRALVPGPLVGQFLAASVLEGAASGQRVVGGVDPSDTPLLVEHLSALDDLVTLADGSWAAARAGGAGSPSVRGFRRLDPSQLAGHEVARPFDPLTPVWRVASLPDGEELGSEESSRRLRPEGAVLTAALQLGIATRTTELAVAYAGEREQFGRPIGAFQAVKHLCADMLVRTEVARAAVYAAAAHLDDPGAGDTGRAVATAKLLADEAAFRNGKTCIQVHGGMGFTWEVDAHLYLKRAAVWRTHFGSARSNAEAIAATL